MKRILLLLLLLSPAMAYANADSLTIQYNGFNTIIVDHQSGSAELLNFTQNIYLYPQDDLIINQDLKNMTIADGFLQFNKQGDFSSTGWSFDFTINSERAIAYIATNPVFPYPVSNTLSICPCIIRC